MIEQHFLLNRGNEKSVTRVIQDDHVHYIHMVFNKDEGLPEHESNAPVYMTILRGVLSIKLNGQEVHTYAHPQVLKIPKGITMLVRNLHDETLELIVVKAPAPTR